MIHHLSIAARDPKQAAEVLAELMGGTAVPFPPNPGSFFALQLDEHGSGVEVYPTGTELQPGGTTGGIFVKKRLARLRIDAFRTQRRDRRRHRANDCPARGMAMLRLQSRPIPCDRGLGRKRDDGARSCRPIRERIPNVYPSRYGQGGHVGGGDRICPPSLRLSSPIPGSQGCGQPPAAHVRGAALGHVGH